MQIQKIMIVSLALILGIMAGMAVPAAAVTMQDVESTSIKQVGYDEATQVLTVVFVTTGETYEYYDVPADVFAQLMAAESKGKFFFENIRDKYRSEKKS